MPAGSVVTQKPARGTGAQGDVITLKRSLGPVLVAIPTVRGKTVAQATELMKEAGFQVVVRPVAVNYIGAGFVVTSRPAAGKEAPKGSSVILFVI